MFTTGAGMGVAGGLGTFRGKNAGVWPPLEEKKIDFRDMSSPKWFSKEVAEDSQESVNFAWAFWQFRHSAYTTAAPHEGYTILRRWGKGKKHGCFSFTSNIDGHWGQCGLDARVLEVHGNVRYMQCADPRSESCKDRVWSSQKQMSKLVIDSSTHCARNPLPRCPECGGLARPNVLMFSDEDFIPTRLEKQRAGYLKWGRALRASGAKLVVVEIGAGSAVGLPRCTN